MLKNNEINNGMALYSLLRNLNQNFSNRNWKV